MTSKIEIYQSNQSKKEKYEKLIESVEVKGNEESMSDRNYRSKIRDNEENNENIQNSGKSRSYIYNVFMYTYITVYVKAGR